MGTQSDYKHAGLGKGLGGNVWRGAHRGVPGLNPNRKEFTSWLSFRNSTGRGQTVGEGLHTSAMFT